MTPTIKPSDCEHKHLGSQDYEIEGQVMKVCFDCKTMVEQAAKSQKGEAK